LLGMDRDHDLFPDAVVKPVDDMDTDRDRHFKPLGHPKRQSLCDGEQFA
jgi:hypothetical protein